MLTSPDQSRKFFLLPFMLEMMGVASIQEVAPEVA
jgi:hypothetical protein